MAQKPSTIFINPKFKNAHINPNFLQPNKIHVNPKFLAQNLLNAQGSAIPKPTIPDKIDPSIETNNPIIRNTRRTLIRAPVATASRSNFPLSISQSNDSTERKRTNYQQQPKQLIKISKTKLVTAAHLMQCQQKENEIIKNTTESIIKSKKLQRKTETKESIYKIDRRQAPLQKKKSNIVSTYSIRRVTPKKVLVTDRKLIRTGQSPAANKSIAMVNINGVLYKSTSHKLEKSNSISSQSNLSAAEKLLIIRGEKFVLDSSGTKLRRDSGGTSLKLSRIDIGGLTYKESQSGSYERDNSHQVRNRLSLAKTKSISLLARSSIHKTNVICPIYRRLGKCLSYANGRCQKVHDQRYVIVCPGFLKGSCKDEKCLLSHNVNLHKMPVCKYFLQGLCQKQRECLYLHKKLTDDTKLCAEFIKGYCPLADKCNLLHEFPHTDQREKKKYAIVRHKPKRSTKKVTESQPAAAESVRYYIDDAQTSDGNVPKRSALGSLPSYIPL